MKIINYTMAWLLMPIMAISHKARRIERYEVRSEKLLTQERDDYIQANECFNSVVCTDRYGEYIKLIEVKKSGEEKVIRSIVW